MLSISPLFSSVDLLPSIINPLHFVGDGLSHGHVLVSTTWRDVIKEAPWCGAACVIQRKWRQCLCLLQRIRAVHKKMEETAEEQGEAYETQFHCAVAWSFDTHVYDPEGHGPLDRDALSSLLHGYFTDAQSLEDEDFEMQRLRAEAMDDDEKRTRQELVEKLLTGWPEEALHHLPPLSKFALLRQIPIEIYDYYEEWVY